MENPNAGRAGRGRGRGGRGQRRQQQQGGAAGGNVQRPGDRGEGKGEISPPQGAQGPPPAGRGVVTEVPQEGDGAGIMGSGRATLRGTSRLQGSRPGGAGDVEELAGRMEGAGLGEGAVGPAGEGARPRRNRFEDPTFRDPNLMDKKGKNGKPIALRGNFFRLSVPDQWTVCQYHVDFFPPCDSRQMKKGLLYCHSQLIGPVSAFDGTVLFLPFRLEHAETVVHSNRRTDNANIKITIRFTCQLSGFTPASAQVLNIIWRKVLAMLGMKQINRHYFNMDRRIDIPQHHMEVIPGFQTSILRYEHDLLLDIDTTHKILSTKTVLDHMNELYDNERDFVRAATKDLVGANVLTRYNNKNYTVDDIAWDARVTDTFEKNGNMISYVDYYKGQHNINIVNMNQPLLCIRSKQRDLRAGQPAQIFLVPELCVMTGLTEKNRSDYQLKKDLDAHTKIGPSKRVEGLNAFMRGLKANETVANELHRWHVNLADNLVNIRGHQLEAEALFMKNRGEDVKLNFSQRDSDWSRDMRGKTMRVAHSLENWLLIYPRNCLDAARTLHQSLENVCPPMGMRFSPAIRRELANDRNDAYLSELRNSVTEDIQIVVCVLPNNRKDRYDAIKKFCCVDRPVPSQMMTQRVMKKAAMSVATKIAIQMNCKLGGSIWACPIPLNYTMIVGFDTYHDSSKRGRSVGGVVATISPDHTQYFSTTTFQTTHMELSNQLLSCLTACVSAFAKVNGQPPQKVIVFRDGVGDGQLDAVAQHEIPEVQAAIGNARLGFVVVKKRTNARFFGEGGDQGGQGRGRGGGGGGGAQGGFSNPPPGTVVDDVATKPAWFDFFLISQSVTQGTVSPTHYNVIKNDINLQPDHYQRLSYKLTHMYYNWQGTVRVPAPCLYAHKLAFLVGQSLHQAPAPRLSQKLYFL